MSVSVKKGDESGAKREQIVFCVCRTPWDDVDHKFGLQVRVYLLGLFLLSCVCVYY